MKPVCRRCKTYLLQKENGDWHCPKCGELIEQQGFCFKCHRPLIRLHKDGRVYCAHCMEPLNRWVDSSHKDTYIRCPNPKCSYEGPELINPSYGTRCPRCRKRVL